MQCHIFAMVLAITFCSKRCKNTAAIAPCFISFAHWNSHILILQYYHAMSISSLLNKDLIHVGYVCVGILAWKRGKNDMFHAWVWVSG